ASVVPSSYLCHELSSSSVSCCWRSAAGRTRGRRRRERLPVCSRRRPFGGWCAVVTSSVVPSRGLSLPGAGRRGVAGGHLDGGLTVGRERELHLAGGELRLTGGEGVRRAPSRREVREGTGAEGGARRDRDRHGLSVVRTHGEHDAADDAPRVRVHRDVE